MPEDELNKELPCCPPPADEPARLEAQSCCRRDNVIPFQNPVRDPVEDPDEAQTNRQLKAMTAATALWVFVLMAAAAAVLFAVPWAVRGIFSWFGIY